jgi:hypothetical protein
MVPPPWHLTGRGYVFLFLGAGDIRGPTTPPGSRFAGGLGVVMILDYTSSDVGPYRELLFIPGTYAQSERRCYSISRIYVSTQGSVTNGWRNWGIPKELADFEIEEGRKGDRVRVAASGRTFFDARLGRGSVALPLTAALLPASLRTIRQFHDGRLIRTAPVGSGAVSCARLVSAEIDEKMFPDFRRFRRLLAVHVGGIRMRFPVPELETAPNRVAGGV